MSLVARHLEAAGIPTVIMGAAKDIVETVGVPRFVFSDVPLGNPAGLPHDPDSQRTVLELALRVLEMAPGPRTTVQSPVAWPGDGGDPHAWKRDFMNLSGLTPDKVARAKADFEEQKRRAKLQVPEGDTPNVSPQAKLQVPEGDTPNVSPQAKLQVPEGDT